MVIKRSRVETIEEDVSVQFKLASSGDVGFKTFRFISDKINPTPGWVRTSKLPSLGPLQTIRGGPTH